jgi:predicted AAA+ superfamily ATPase
LYDEYLRYGGFPEVTLSINKKQKIDLLNDIMGSYLHTDIKAFTEIRNERNISNLLKLLSASVCSKLDYTKLSSLSGISRPTLYNYLDLFENTFLIARLGVYSKSIGRQVVKAPKLYFCDNGLLNILSRVSGGAIFENSIFNQLKHYGNLSYWQEKSGNEIDFILDSKYSFESKESASKRDFEKLKRLSILLKLKNPKLAVKNLPKNFSEFIWGGDIL